MIRPAVLSDLDRVIEIYNQAIIDRVHANCDELQTSSDKFASIYFGDDPRYFILVYESEAGEVEGWGAVKRFSARPYDRSAGEVAVYIARESRSRGHGVRILRALMSRAKAADFHSLVAIILGENIQSIRGAASCGFEEKVRIPAIAYQYGKYSDIVWLQKVMDRD
ncbi:MAG TPA: GNAT family N-acetyltransferase [Stellaceae bacterium]|nr:GNAT family N-acetyltransferase [Stellaceae bacterium]